MTEIYRMLYCSRNTLEGTIEDQNTHIEEILATSRANNSSNHVTGALLFNHGYFAQVLEGSMVAVEQTFERIQQDMRHDEITVLECGHVAARDFPEWSMAYAGTAHGDLSAAETSTLPTLLDDKSNAAAEINAFLRRLVLQNED